MLRITGFGSKIAKELITMLPDNEAYSRILPNDITGKEGDRYLFCQGYMEGEGPLSSVSEAKTWAINYTTIVRACEKIFTENPCARVCIVGSESGISGSFDRAYAGSKAAIHNYVETRNLIYPAQQLVAVAPSIIRDAGMTVRRKDQNRVSRRASGHPRMRFPNSIEVARLIHFLLYVDAGFICNTVIRMNGGEHVRK